MRLLHYTARPFEFDPARRYEQVGHYAGWKPAGFWLSVDGGDDCWRSWCEGEAWGLERLAHASEVTLKPSANVLVIDTPEKLDAFDMLYGDGDRHSLRSIDWPRVKRVHDGVIIAPYHWSRRLDLMWYYGWDCASGVIWNLPAIAEVKACEKVTA